MHHVLVGAGAVGVVYADALLRAGHTVTFLVREKYAKDVAAGTRLYVGKEARDVVPSAVVTTTDALAARAKNAPVDVLWWCVPANALDDAAWVNAVLDAVGGARVIEFAGGPGANDLVSRRVDDARRIEGIISYLAWQTPLPGGLDGAREAGIAFWGPPAPSSIFSGKDARLVVDALKKGGHKAALDPNVPTKRALGAALLTSFVIALEAADWKLKDAPRVLGTGGREALAAVSAETGRGAFPLTLVARPFVASLVIALAKSTMPLPLETYLAFHFQKVRTQMHQNVKGLLAVAEKHAIPSPTLTALAKKVGAVA